VGYGPAPYISIANRSSVVTSTWSLRTNTAPCTWFSK
jgi:hypothetical protein